MHRTQSYNELSGRYSKLPNLYYIPSTERLMSGKQSITNKQGSENGISKEDAEQIRVEMENAVAVTRGLYDLLLERGVSRELARLILPVNQYSRMRASGNLRNWMAFLTLRMDPAAQWEIRQYAEAIHDELKVKFPHTMELFDE